MARKPLDNRRFASGIAETHILEVDIEVLGAARLRRLGHRLLVEQLLGARERAVAETQQQNGKPQVDGLAIQRPGQHGESHQVLDAHLRVEQQVAAQQHHEDETGLDDQTEQGDPCCRFQFDTDHCPVLLVQRPVQALQGTTETAEAADHCNALNVFLQRCLSAVAGGEHVIGVQQRLADCHVDCQRCKRQRDQHRAGEEGVEPEQ